MKDAIYLKGLDLSVIKSFISKNKKYRTNLSKKYLLSTFRKFVREINNEANLDYKDKLLFNKKQKKMEFTLKEQISIIRELKEKHDIQSFLLFYFLSLYKDGL